MQNNKKTLDNMISKTKIYLAIIGILFIILCFQNYKLILPSIVVYSLVLMYAYWTNNKRKAEISKHIEQLTINVYSAAKNTLINSPFPLIIADRVRSDIPVLDANSFAVISITDNDSLI